jgi:hypothetical protein
MRPSLRNRFIKKLTLDRVVPTISARVPWLTFRLAVYGVDCAPKPASNRRVRGEGVLQRSGKRSRETTGEDYRSLVGDHRRPTASAI